MDCGAWRNSTARSSSAFWLLCLYLHLIAVHCTLAGGTESILLAVKASRDYTVAKRGITTPEMVVGPSAHAAYWKAAEYFNIKLVIAPLGKDLRCVHELGLQPRLLTVPA